MVFAHFSDPKCYNPIVFIVVVKGEEELPNRVKSSGEICIAIKLSTFTFTILPEMLPQQCI